jgi:hypothetical protein
MGKDKDKKDKPEDGDGKKDKAAADPAFVHIQTCVAEIQDLMDELMPRLMGDHLRYRFFDEKVRSKNRVEEIRAELAALEKTIEKTRLAAGSSPSHATTKPSQAQTPEPGPSNLLSPPIHPQVLEHALEVHAVAQAKPGAGSAQHMTEIEHERKREVGKPYFKFRV